MDSKPIITLGVASYNTDTTYLTECIKSIEAQTYDGSMQIVWVDDGSEESNSEFVRNAIQKMDPRFEVKYIKLADNMGLGYVRKCIVDNAIGEFVFIVDSDDIQSPFRVSSQVAYLVAHPEIAACGMQMQQFRADQPISDTTIPNMSWSTYIWNPTHFFAAHPTMAYRRDTLLEIGNYNPKLRYLEDFDLHVRLLKKTHNIINLPLVGIYYRLHADQSTKKTTDWQCHSLQHAMIGYYCYNIPIARNLFAFGQSFRGILCGEE